MVREAVVVNLQKTHVDNRAQLRISHDCDVVMRGEPAAEVVGVTGHDHGRAGSRRARVL